MIWAYIIVDVVMVGLGLIFAFSYFTNNDLVLGIIEPPALFLSSWLLLFILIQLFVAIVGVLIRARIMRRTPVSDQLKERLQYLGVATLTRMKIDRPIGFSVAQKSSEAFAVKNRIYVGDRQLQTAPDDEVVFSIAHEMGHLLKKYLSAMMRLIFVVRVVVFLAALYFASLSDAGTIIGVTVLAASPLVRMPLYWRLEYSADAEAARRLGPEPVLVSLEKLRETNYDGLSFTHPPLSRRIRRIQFMLTAS